ncbi:unnamed protein product [Choristocarpus tenellus]
MPPKRRTSHERGMDSKRDSNQDSTRRKVSEVKRRRQNTTALAWGDDNIEDPDSSSNSEDEGDRRAGNKEKRELGELAEIAEAEARETAEEKRLRLARDVLHRLDREEQEKHDGSDEEDGEDYLGEKLAHARLEATGMLYREVARGLEGKQIYPSTLRRMRGHKLTPTCVALSPDDKTVFSGSKDNSIVRWDVETGKRTLVRPRWRKLPGGTVPDVKAHSNEVLALAVSGDGRYLVSGGRDRLVHVWDCRTDELVESFRGHQDAVSTLAFRSNSLALFSGSHDRCVKHWDLNEMGYVETMFGHQSEINAIDACHKERAVTGGRDRTVRLWKVLEDSHLVFRPVGGGSIDCVSMLNDDWFVTGGEDGHLSLWFAMKKKPAAVALKAHGCGPSGAPRWISALCCLKQSDLVVSGSNDGFLRLWHANTEGRSLEQVSSVEMGGFVNGLAISSTGKFVVAAVGPEHRLGRWERQQGGHNEICVVPLPSENPQSGLDEDSEDHDGMEDSD